MNDFELQSKLKSLRVPERPEAYWADFPSRLRVQLRREGAGSAARRGWRFRLTWACDFAVVAALVFICLEYHPLQSAAAALQSHEKYFHAQMARLDKGLHKLVLNTDGMGYLLAEAN
jgi:hypothetical protein